MHEGLGVLQIQLFALAISPSHEGACGVEMLEYGWHCMAVNDDNSNFDHWSSLTCRLSLCSLRPDSRPCIKPNLKCLIPLFVSICPWLNIWYGTFRRNRFWIDITMTLAIIFFDVLEISGFFKAWHFPI